MCYFPQSGFTRCSFDLRLFIAQNCVRDHELQAGRSWSSLSTKDFAVSFHLPKRRRGTSPAQEMIAGLPHMGILSFLERA